MPRIEILTIGDELVEGRLVDTNAGELSAKLADLGLGVTEHRSVGDDMGEMVRALRSATDRADAVLVSGGLGPTSDDLTAAAAAAAFNLEIERSDEALEHTRRFFVDRGREMPPTNEKQADLPAGCAILPNPEGTAVGFSVDVNKCRLYFMPGVPREIRAMADESVIPDLVGRFTSTPPLIATLKIFGKGESEVAHSLGGLEDLVPHDARLTVQYRATFPEIHLRLIVDCDDRRIGSEVLDTLAEDVVRRMGRHVFAVGGAKVDTDFPASVAASLLGSGVTLATAEIASGGRAAQMLGTTENGRRVLRGSLVTADAAVLAQQLATEEITAASAAESIRELFHTDFGVATFGSVDESDGHRPGELVVAASGPVGGKLRELYFPTDVDRFQRLAAYAALGLVTRMVESNR